MSQQHRSIFAASRAAAQQIMDDRPQTTLRYETTNDARIRAHLLQTTNLEDNQIDVMLKHYHQIARLRMSLGMREGSAE